MQIRYAILSVLILFTFGCDRSDSSNHSDASIQSLDQLSISALRSREYSSSIKIEKKMTGIDFDSYLASYRSDGLRVYTRIDVPMGPAPTGGYPVVIFVHGWRGIDLAPSLEFYYSPESYYYKMVEGYRNAGFVVLAPGLRGHGTVDNVPAQGIEYMAAWDNGTYLSPVFYAIDILNLLDGLQTLKIAPINSERVNLSGHSQGGDTTLLVLAVAGEDSKVKQPIYAASIWSGAFAPRFTQLQTYAPMQQTSQAFVSGDGTWTGSAIGNDGSVNPNFIFWYPSDWIESVDVQNWTWQRETWSFATVAEVLKTKLDQMYDGINQNVADINNATYTLSQSESGKTTITHDPRVVTAMSKIDAFDKTQYLSEPLALQYSDRDFYSFPKWNEQLCKQMTQTGTACYPFEYRENTHSLGVSKHRWFSSEETIPGLPLAIRRDTALFLGQDVRAIK